MSTYYIAHQGQQQGPFSLADIESKLKSDKLFWHDYIYDSKSEDWVLMMEYPSLTKSFNQSFANPIKDNPKVSKPESDPMKRRIWYVLKQNNNYGPFSKTELIQMLQGKTLHEFDFIWHNGMLAWKRLSEVSDFSTSEVQAVFELIKNNKDDSGQSIFFRRKHPRAKYNSHAVIHDNKKIYKTTSVEISSGGAGLIIEDAKFEIDQQIYLHFKPGQNVPAFNSICKIVSQKGNLFGVQFIKISGAAKSSITEFTNSFEKKSAA
jgi:hypothetical protein